MVNFIRDLFSPVLSDRSIRKYMKKGLLIETPITEAQIQPNSVDLTLGREWRKLESNSKELIRDSDTLCERKYKKYINPKLPIQYRHGYFEFDKHCDCEIYVLQPHEFILMASNEILNIPNGIISFVQGRSSIARLAIQTEQAGLIDAGFRGTITFEVFNQSEFPIVLYPGMRIAQLYFFKAEKAKIPYGVKYKNSKYHEQIEPTGSRINMDFI